MASFLNAGGRFHVREYPPVGVGYATNKLPHRPLVYLIRRVPHKGSGAGGFTESTACWPGASPEYLDLPTYILTDAYQVPRVASHLRSRFQAAYRIERASSHAQ